MITSDRSGFLRLDAIRQLMAPPEKERRAIGFKVEEAEPRYRVRRLGRRVRV